MLKVLTEVTLAPDGPTSTEKLVKCVVVHCKVLLSICCVVVPSVDHPPLINTILIHKLAINYM